jgi:hypothetical protein
MALFRFWIIRNSRTAFSIQTLLFFSIFVGITRGMLEQLFFGIEVAGSDILGYIPFYFTLPFIYATLLSFIPGLKYEQVLQPVTFATLLGILPPIFDFLLGNGKTHNIFYGYYLSHDYRNFPWLGLSPARNYPLGEAITIWLTLFLAGLFVLSRTRSTLKGIFAICIAYIGFLFYSLVIPGLTSLLLLGFVENPTMLERQNAAVLRHTLFLLSAVQIFTAWIVDSWKSGLFSSYAKRLLHFLPFLMLAILGGVLSRAETLGISIAAVVTLCSAIAVVAQNDFLKVDPKNQRAVGLANVTAVMVYAMVLFAGYKIALLGLACFSLSVLYHYEFFNIRATLLGSMKVEGMWGFLTFLSGVFAGTIDYPNYKIVSLGALIFGGFSLFSMLKDAKDLRADFREGRQTIFTFFFKKKIKMRKTLRFAALIFASVICATGGGYFSLHGPTFWIHLMLGILGASFVLKVHRQIYFQCFMLCVCGIVTNLIVYEYAFR